MAIQYLTPEQTEHPLRHTISQEDMALILQGIADNDNWMSLEEIEAVQDMLFDRIAAELQTVPGSLAIN